jgi:hypothetical protein
MRTPDTRVTDETSSSQRAFARFEPQTEADMRSTYAIAFATFLMATPAMSQVIIQTPNGDAGRHEERAQRDRWEARQERQEAERRAAMGDYRGAAEADSEARRDWRDARRQQDRAQEDSGGVIIGR